MRNLKRITLYIMSIVDIFSLIAAFIVSYIIKFRLVEKNSEGLVSSSSYMTLLVCSILAYLLVNIIFLYNDNFIERSSAKELLATLKMVVYVTIMIILFMFFAKISNQYSRAHVAIFSILAFLIDAVSRIVIKKYVLQKYKNRNGSKKIVVIAPYSHIPEILKKLENPLNWNCKVVGVVASDYDKKGETVQGIPVISNSEYMYKDIANAEVDSVFVDTGSETHEYIRSCTQKMQEIGKKVHVRVEEYYINDSIRTIDRLGEYAVVSYFPNYPMRVRQILVKRAFDVLICIVLIPIYFVLFVVAAFFTYAESPGKILISTIKIGKNGRRFYQYRFRVFRLDAEERMKSGKSPYTKIGRVLEMLHLDGMPLLINVIYGDMSLVGPKSPTVEKFLQYSAQQRKNLCVQTGVVGYWSCETDENEIVKLEDEYIAKWNLLWDFKIIFEMILRYLSFHSKRKNYIEEMREQALEQIVQQRAYCKSITYEHSDYQQNNTVGKKIYYTIKRLADIVGAVAGMVILSPVFLIVMILVIADDGGNPFYGHVRVGKNGKKITVYKFRSMRKDAGDLEKLLTPEQLAQYKREFKIDNDPRITKVGNFIRKTSIDELPQLFNILKGDISIVGPRPIVQKETEIYGKDIAKLLSVKPGLTGYWQAYARNNATYASGERQKMEMYYVEHQSLWLDIKILFKTVESVFKQEGAQ